MKKLSVFFFTIVTIFAYSQVKWMSIEDALKAQETTPKKILIDFYANWCEACKKMDSETFSNPIIADYINQNYYPVKFDTESKQTIYIYGKQFVNLGLKTKNSRNPVHEFAKFMNINATPSLVFLDEQSMPITILQGALTAKELEPYLPFFINGEYKKILTSNDWENYQKKFITKIK